ncbi:hypothetical protein CW752_08610 [Chryseobacterium sp. PMSZPI]|nr:hypothetical protein CW752_08610 [Chryseobacterium sp. PMSZPI]
MNKLELSYCVDIHTHDLDHSLLDSTSKVSNNKKNCIGLDIHHHHDRLRCILDSEFSQNNSPAIEDIDFFLTSLKDIRSAILWEKWMYLPLNNKDEIVYWKENGKININSYSLIDGFKFIIKIPDKLENF